MSTIEEILYEHREDALTCYDHASPGVWCCVCGAHALTVSHRTHVAAVLQVAAIQVWDDGVRQAITWLRADYPYGDGPDWRERGCEWISERLAEYNAARVTPPGVGA